MLKRMLIIARSIFSDFVEKLVDGKLFDIFRKVEGARRIVYCEKLLAVNDSTRVNPLQPPRDHRNYVQRFTRHSR